MKRGNISITPGVFKGMGSKRNYNVKPPKLGGGKGIPAPALIAKALGVTPGMPVHQGAVGQLMSHPDTNVVAAAKRLMSKY